LKQKAVDVSAYFVLVSGYFNNFLLSTFISVVDEAFSLPVNIHARFDA